MKISIITPVKNLEHYISETIESVINQRGDFELEYLIMDGQSEDNTLKICEDYQLQIQSKSRAIFCNSIDFKIVSKPDSTMYEALSMGLQIVSGDIVSFINGDDFYLPNALSCVNEIFSKFKRVSWITGMPVRYNERGQIIDIFIPWQYNSKLILMGFHGNQLSIIQQESVFWRKELSYDVEFEKMYKFKLAGDFFLWHSFAKSNKQLFVVDSFLGGNRLRRGQLSENKKKYYKEFNHIKDSCGIMDCILASFYWLMERLAGKPVKRRLSKNRISYINGSWVLK